MKSTFVTDNIFCDLKNTSLALGFFDGIHLGHQKVLSDALDYSRKLGTKSTVLTFKNHPVELLYGVKPEFITTWQERLEIFKDMGFDAVIMTDFTKEIAQMNAKEYFEKIIMRFSPKSISIGYNHRFGHEQSGDIDFLSDMSKKNNFILSVAQPVKTKNEITSSTLIRNFIKNGEVEKASELLGKHYSVKNIVIEGAQRGRTINFPTANIEFPKNKIIPKFGVYAGYININNKRYDGVANVGVRPTFGDIATPLIEVNILNFEKDIYSQQVEFEFVKKIRDEVKFSSIEKLKEQIQKDVSDAVMYLK